MAKFIKFTISPESNIGSSKPLWHLLDEAKIVHLHRLTYTGIVKDSKTYCEDWAKSFQRDVSLLIPAERGILYTQKFFEYQNTNEKIGQYKEIAEWLNQ